MADSNLNTPVIVQATRLDTSILPRNIFSQSYLLYVIAQGTDVGNVANKANEAGQGAYDAQVRNDEQDVILVDHEERIRQLRIEVDDHEIRIGGIVYYQEIQPQTFDCHAMYLPEIRGFSKEIGLAFWRYILTNTTVQCVTSFAARKFRHGQMYCAMIGLKRVGTIKKYFKGVDDVTFYSATREELIDFLNHGR